MLTARRPPSISHDDPLSIIMRPPDTETESERRSRLLREAEAKRVSEAIDEELRADRKMWEKQKRDIRLLLLGQAESGKSTLQKQFQLIHNPESLEDERASWRMVVYYNITRSVKHILEVLEAYGDSPDGETPEGSSDGSSYGHGIGSRSRGRSPSVGASAASSRSNLENQRVIASLRLKLSPLVVAEASLADRLSGGYRNPGKSKVFVRRGWQSRTVQRRGTRSLGGSPEGWDDYNQVDTDEMVEEVARILDICQGEVRQLWENEVVRKLIKRRRLRLEESAEYFMRDVSRVAARGYIPEVDDILHARIQTMGVAEHTFDVPLHGKPVTWHLYDVGGARGQRHSWVPYFDNANAIIFVAPISAFDQYLEEDPRTNRIDDSLQLFTSICSNPLLKNVHLVLFLNKCDVLQAKLAAGVRVNKYITSFGERPNDYDTIVSYFRAHFNQVHRKTNDKKRVLYSHLTSVVDTKTTRSIIANVRDSIFRDYLKSAALV
ncbi:G-protein alpha subunit [Amylostereum chailletii]|nr:G-protein alpha subunit [Amylostereum chailletii]